MAELKPTRIKPDTSLFDTTIVVWEDITSAADTAAPIALGDHADKCVQILDTAGTGNILIQGSNDPRVLSDPVNADWVTCKNTADADMTFAAATPTAGFGTIRDNFYFIKFAMSGGTVTGGRVAINMKRHK